MAKWMHVVAICHCSENTTDGIVDAIALRQIINDANVPASAAKRCIPKLVAAGLWIDRGDSYEIRDFLDYNPSAAAVKEKRDAARERMANLRASRSREQEENFARSSVTPSPTPTHERSSAVRALVDDALRGAA